MNFTITSSNTMKAAYTAIQSLASAATTFFPMHDSFTII